MKLRFGLLLVLVVAMAVFIAACAQPTPEVITETVIETVVVEKVVEGETITVVETVEVVKEVEKVVEVEADLPAGEALRRKTVIFDIGGGRVTNPESWNPYIPGAVEGYGLPPGNDGATFHPQL